MEPWADFMIDDAETYFYSHKNDRGTTGAKSWARQSRLQRGIELLTSKVIWGYNDAPIFLELVLLCTLKRQ